MSDAIAPDLPPEAGTKDQLARWRWGLKLLAAFSLSLAVPLVALPLVSRSPLWALLPAAVHQAANPWLELDEQLPGILPAFGLAIVAVWLVGVGIRATMGTFLERGFYGRDLLKPGAQHKIPEMIGLPAACLYMLLLFIFIPCRYVEETFPVASTAYGPGSKKGAVRNLLGVGLAPQDQGSLAEWLKNRTVGSEAFEAWARTQPDGGWNGRMSGRQGFPHHQLATFLSALLSILSAIMLGFLDDVFDIRWRHKLPIPMISSIPMLVVYFAGGGGTHIVVPFALRNQLPGEGGAALVDLGVLYYVYITMLSIFCTNSINILAGINGVEVGQALVIALSLCVNDLLYLDTRAGLGGSKSSIELVQRHLFSLYVLLPFVGTCIGLLYYNRYPARAFVGDTFCYFAGQVLACVGILGHFSKTLLLFFFPQVFNFLFSCPQLFGLVPIPRHRVPCVVVDDPTPSHPGSIRVYPSSVAWTEGTHAKPIASILLTLAEVFHLVRLERNAEGKIVGTTNLTLLNAILVFIGVQGPMVQPGPPILKGQPKPKPVPATSGQVTGPRLGEQGLFLLVMLVQVVGSTIAFGIRHWGAFVFYPQP